MHIKNPVGVSHQQDLSNNRLNAEYCCLFSAIIASDRGYKVTYIEDATASVNNGGTYEMKDLDIVDFIWLYIRLVRTS